MTQRQRALKTRMGQYRVRLIRLQRQTARLLSTIAVMRESTTVELEQAV